MSGGGHALKSAPLFQYDITLDLLRGVLETTADLGGGGGGGTPLPLRDSTPADPKVSPLYY